MLSASVSFILVSFFTCGHSESVAKTTPSAGCSTRVAAKTHAACLRRVWKAMEDRVDGYLQLELADLPLQSGALLRFGGQLCLQALQSTAVRASRASGETELDK